MPINLPAIEYDPEFHTVDSPNSTYTIPMYKPEEYFSNLDSYVAFIKACEQQVRKNDRYSKYIAYLKKEIGLNHCQVLTNIDGNKYENVDIEMHHGPILTLYDYCAIITEWLLTKRRQISTFRVADIVLTEHQKNHIQVVMLATTVHEQVHARGIFLNYKHAWGDLNSFIKTYRDGISVEYVEKINRYIERSLLYDSNDFGVLKLNQTLTRF